MSDEELFQAHLQKHIGEKDLKCYVCGNEQWAVIREKVRLVQDATERKITIDGSIYYRVTCQTCGNTLLFNVTNLGVK